MDGPMIILICALGLIGLLAYFIFRFGSYKRKVRPVEETSLDIGRTDRMMRKDPSVMGHSVDIPTIPDGQVLIVLHRKTGQNWKRAVTTSLKNGRKGVIISVTDPEKLRSRYRGDVRFIWLERSNAHTVRKDSVVVNPTNLSMILQEIESMISSEGIVVITDLEDILGSNETSRIVRFLRMLDDSCSKKGYSALVPASYRAIPQRVRVQLTESFDTVVI